VEIYTMKEAALYLGVSIRTVRYYTSKGLLVPARWVGRSPLFDKAELDRFAATPRPGRGRPRKAPPDKDCV
jgi:excisionase family DNA binding protein